MVFPIAGPSQSIIYPETRLSTGDLFVFWGSAKCLSRSSREALEAGLSAVNRSLPVYWNESLTNTGLLMKNKLSQLVTDRVAVVSVSGAMEDAGEDVLVRTKRQTTCAAKFQIVSGHTACLSVSDTQGVSDADKQVIVDKHNEFRAAASPTASNMLKMEWDDEIAMIAQKWADNCDLNHDQNRWVPGRFGVGQNLAMGASDWTGAITMWHNEVTEFTYGDSAAVANNWQDIAHYTAMMWATTNLVGCGYRLCSNTQFHVCNYAPAGNSQGQLHEPYKQGNPCADCPGHCVDGKLCDCSGLTCLNGGDMDLTTCTCSCKNNPVYTQPDCSLNCTGGADGGQCGNTAYTCPAYKVFCPFKCQICPFADPNYGDSQSGGSTSTSTTSTTVEVCSRSALTVQPTRLVSLPSAENGYRKPYEKDTFVPLESCLSTDAYKCLTVT
ncbi:hypothetical protein BaRGS_00017287 [Batillaria attramentaria]|uniref:SCP domain-containing protein n=1 Tax=Batillaria attramentaria TaxID=370345 RepID=A0ABD0KWB8_9CAEN